MRDYAQLLLDHDTVAIGVLHYRFGYLDSTAVANNLVYWDGNTPAQLHDVPGRPRSPYFTRDVTVVAALVNKPRSGTVTFRLDPALFFTNTGRALNSATVDFGDGNGAQSLWFGQTRTVSYGSAGPKVLRYTLVFSDGTQQTTCSIINVTNPVVFARGNKRDPEPACYTVPLLTSDITYARNGRPGVGDVSYYYSVQANTTCPNSQRNVVKPIVLIDGFDHDDERKAGNLYADGLAYNDNRSGITQEYNLGTELRAQGYDVVILNFPKLFLGFSYNGFFRVPKFYRGGSSYIEANAFVLVKLLQQLQTQMGTNSPEKITIVGPSMGGQIAKYALAYMEHNNLPHNVGLYISLDSPHNGANTPIGDQLFLKYFAEDIGTAQAWDGLQAVNSPASRELSLQHHSQLPVSIGWGGIPVQGNTVPFQADPERGQYLVNLSNAGIWPQQPRRVAVTNGSLSALRQLKTTNSSPIVDGEQAFYLRGKWNTIGVAAARVYFSSGYGNSMKMVEGHYPVGNGRNYYAIGPPNSCGLDGAAGGWFDINQEIAERVQGTEWSAFKLGAINTNINSLQKNACFIPMHSALAYQPANGNPDDYCQPLTSDNLICNGTVPFDAFYGPLGLNEAHTQLTAGNVAFMRNEILNVTPAPEFTAAPTAICPGTTTTFTIRNCAPRAGQPATTYDWTLSGPAVFVSTAAGSQFLPGAGPSQQVQATAASGTVTLTVVARRVGAAASVPVVRTLPISAGEIQITGDPLQRSAASAKALPADAASAPSYTCSQTVNLFATGFNAAPPYTETIRTYRNTGTSTRTYTVATAAFQVTVNDFDVDVTLTGTSACDGTRITSNTVYLPGCASAQVARPAAYPNPADAVLHLTAPETPEAAPAARTAVLYNAQGREVRRTTAPAATQLPTADLPTGLYYLVMEQNGRVSRSQVRVQH